MITGEQAEAVGELRICRNCQHVNNIQAGRYWSSATEDTAEWECREPIVFPSEGYLKLLINPVDGEVIWPKCAERNKNGDCALFKKYVKPEPEPDTPKRRWWRRG